ncbi:hypothetical protein [Pseudanabaena sp. 'Roaring Creek']|uniref:hypothetical protein n=1 Tax=Pseudanabaena sp. 'Roaring Creek' TaxID=1681830 RepID=UPI0006D7763A|nr:hypothetical protein [Pseudanabaena sp. 'Roaring Creek']
MATKNLPQDTHDEDQPFYTKHGATSEEQCIKMGRKYGWDYSHFELTKDPILTHECFYEGNAEFPKLAGGKNSE